MSKRTIGFFMLSLVLVSCQFSRHLKPQYTHLLKVPVPETQHFSDEKHFNTNIHLPEDDVACQQNMPSSEDFKKLTENAQQTQWAELFEKKSAYYHPKLSFEAGRSNLKITKRELLKNILSKDNISREDIIFWLIVTLLVVLILYLLRIDVIAILTTILLILLIILILQLLEIHVLS